MNLQKDRLDVSIIIVNYNTLKLTQNCIQSIIDKTNGISYEIIIVDNASTDGSKEYFESDSKIKYIYSEENLGFGRANNLGAQSAVGNKLFFLNPDTLLINNAIKILSDYLDVHPKTGGAGGNLYNKDLKPCLSFKRYLPGLFWELNNMTFATLEKIVFIGNQTFNNTNNVKSVGYITGADLMIPKRIFNDLGGFDSKFFLYFEETDLCCRIRELGLKIESVPASRIQHLEGESFKGGEINRNRIRHTEKGRYTYYHKHFNLCEQKILNGIYSFNLWFKSLIHPNSYRRWYSKEQLIQFKDIWNIK